MDGFKDYLKKTNQYNNIRMIDKTSVGEFLNIWENKNLQNALTRAFGNGDPDFDVIEEYKKRGSADGKVRHLNSANSFTMPVRKTAAYGI